MILMSDLLMSDFVQIFGSLFCGGSWFFMNE
jgi:hypothetical protein